MLLTSYVSYFAIICILYLPFLTAAEAVASSKRKADESAKAAKVKADNERKARADADNKAKKDTAAASAATAVKKVTVVNKVTPKPVQTASTDNPLDDLVCPLRGVGLLPPLKPAASNKKK